jgi:protein ImuB
MYACMYVPDFATQAALRFKPRLNNHPVAIVAGEPPQESVFATNAASRQLGLVSGMSLLQAESFAGVHLFRRSFPRESSAQNALLECASSYSPRVEAAAPQSAAESGGTVVLDIRGTDSLFGSPRQLAESAHGKLQTIGLLAQIAVAENFHAAISAARGHAGVTVLPQGREADILAPLPLAVLGPTADMEDTFRLWGIRTCGELAALPERDLISRLGQHARRLRDLALGQHPHLLVPVEEDFASGLFEVTELDHPVDQLESLLFLFARMLDSLLERVNAHALAISAIHITLKLEKSDPRIPPTHLRSVRPALPTSDAQALLKLVQLDLETHAPPAAVLAIEMRVEPARPQQAQHGLFLPQSPEPGRLDILLARLRKLLGEDRVGVPQLLDSHNSESFRMSTFAPPPPRARISRQSEGSVVLRVCRPPLAIIVTTCDTRPTAVYIEGQHYSVLAQAGPWRTSGQWWSQTNWCREEWDVILADRQRQMTSRIAHDPASDCWYMQGVYD